jgi:hypothetical protein
MRDQSRGSDYLLMLDSIDMRPGRFSTA